MTFTGEVRASYSVASILVAVAVCGLWAATYNLNFRLPTLLQSDYWGFLTLLSLAVTVEVQRLNLGIGNKQIVQKMLL